MKANWIDAERDEKDLETYGCLTKIVQAFFQMLRIIQIKYWDS